MEKDSRRLEPLLDPSIKVIKRALSEAEMSQDDLAKAKIATNVLSTFAKLKQSERAQEGNIISLAQLLTSDPAQRLEYIRASSPELAKLPEPKKK